MNKILRNKQGSTLVELLASFLIVMIILAAFTLAFTTAMNLYNKSINLVHSKEQADSNYYQSSKSGGSGNLSLKGETTIPLDHAKLNFTEGKYTIIYE